MFLHIFIEGWQGVINDVPEIDVIVVVVIIEGDTEDIDEVSDSDNSQNDPTNDHLKVKKIKTLCETLLYYYMCVTDYA